MIILDLRWTKICSSKIFLMQHWNRCLFQCSGCRGNCQVRLTFLSSLKMFSGSVVSGLPDLVEFLHHLKISVHVPIVRGEKYLHLNPNLISFQLDYFDSILPPLLSIFLFKNLLICSFFILSIFSLHTCWYVPSILILVINLKKAVHDLPNQTCARG